MIEKIYTSILILILFVLLYSLYIAYEYDNNTLKIYDHKIKCIKQGITGELQQDFKKYNINCKEQNALKKLANKILYEEISVKKSIFKKVVNSSLTGIVQGGVTGFITGGLPGLLGGSIVFGTIIPIVTAYKELNPPDETLIYGLQI